MIYSIIEDSGICAFAITLNNKKLSERIILKVLSTAITELIDCYGNDLLLYNKDQDLKLKRIDETIEEVNEGRFDSI